jgi:prepilin-type processing-associated H-X9-DG protein
MYCPKCGVENPDGAQTCNACKCVFRNDTGEKPFTNPKTSRLAIASLALGILSIFVLPILIAIPAVGLGIMSLLRIKKSSGQLKGKELAIAGIAIAVFVITLTQILTPEFALKPVAHRIACGTNMAALGKAMFVYANDNIGEYPSNSIWCDLLIKHAKVNQESFCCKGARQGPCNYAMNKNAAGIFDLPDMVLLFETKPGWNQSGGPEILSTENHKGQGCNILFNDGHVEFVKIKDINKLKWIERPPRMY